MSRGRALLTCLLLAACAGPRPVPAPHATLLPVPRPDYAAPIAALRVQMAQAVPGDISSTPEHAAFWIARTQDQLAAAAQRITRPQLLVAVDRNPSVQQMRVIFANPDGPWRVIGGGLVSTGRAGRYGYFITPTGVFIHDDSILDYRALGTYNENHIRGLGAKGSRVWDFGWQSARRGWGAADTRGEIRLLLHATDPDVLEPRLGRPDSKGCVRISAAMNAFLDRHAVLDAAYLKDAATNPRIAALLRPNLDPSPYAGAYLVIFDSSKPPPKAAAAARSAQTSASSSWAKSR